MVVSQFQNEQWGEGTGVVLAPLYINLRDNWLTKDRSRRSVFDVRLRGQSDKIKAKPKGSVFEYMETRGHLLTNLKGQ